MTLAVNVCASWKGPTQPTAALPIAGMLSPRCSVQTRPGILLAGPGKGSEDAGGVTGCCQALLLGGKGQAFLSDSPSLPLSEQCVRGAMDLARFEPHPHWPGAGSGSWSCASHHCPSWLSSPRAALGLLALGERVPSTLWACPLPILRVWHFSLCHKPAFPPSAFLQLPHPQPHPAHISTEVAACDR